MGFFSHRRGAGTPPTSHLFPFDAQLSGLGPWDIPVESRLAVTLFLMVPAEKFQEGKLPIPERYIPGGKAACQ